MIVRLLEAISSALVNNLSESRITYHAGSDPKNILQAQFSIRLNSGENYQELTDILSRIIQFFPDFYIVSSACEYDRKGHRKASYIIKPSKVDVAHDRGEFVGLFKSICRCIANLVEQSQRVTAQASSINPMSLVFMQHDVFIHYAYLVRRFLISLCERYLLSDYNDAPVAFEIAGFDDSSRVATIAFMMLTIVPSTHDPSWPHLNASVAALILPGEDSVHSVIIRNSATARLVQASLMVDPDKLVTVMRMTRGMICPTMISILRQQARQGVLPSACNRFRLLPSVSVVPPLSTPVQSHHP